MRRSGERLHLLNNAKVNQTSKRVEVSHQAADTAIAILRFTLDACGTASPESDQTHWFVLADNKVDAVSIGAQKAWVDYGAHYHQFPIG